LKEIKAEVGANALVMDRVQRAPYTFVRVKACLDDQDWWAVGFAKCNPVDEWIPMMGFEIAFGRAINTIARDVLARRSGQTVGIIGDSPLKAKARPATVVRFYPETDPAVEGRDDLAEVFCRDVEARFKLEQR
jgi:hypothetical protein